MIYDYSSEKFKRAIKGKIVLAVIVIAVITTLVIAKNIYLELIELNEIGSKLSSIFLTNLTYRLVSFAAIFILIFTALFVSNIFIIKNSKRYLADRGIERRKLPSLSIALGLSILGALATQNVFYLKILNYLNFTPFGKSDPIFSKDIGYYIFQRPFLMSLYDFLSGVVLFVAIYTAVYYLAVFLLANGEIALSSLKFKPVIRHTLINVSLYFLTKIFSYKFIKEGILYKSVLGYNGANYVDDVLWKNYYTYIPYLVLAIVAVSLFFIWKGRLKKAAYSIAVFPAVWVLVALTAVIMQSLVVKPNEKNYESKYLSYNIEKTREAFRINNIISKELPDIAELTYDTLQKNSETMNNIRVIDYEATLQSDRQRQSLRPYYNFIDGDIINLTINGKQAPVFITARELDKNNIPEKGYINTRYRYTHGYGIVVNPINKLKPNGEVDYIISDLTLKSTDNNLVVSEPRIYYGELTNDHVIVNAQGIKEIDYDGERETVYEGTGGIKLNFLNRLLFALEYGESNMVISG